MTTIDKLHEPVRLAFLDALKLTNQLNKDDPDWTYTPVGEKNTSFYKIRITDETGEFVGYL